MIGFAARPRFARSSPRHPEKKRNSASLAAVAGRDADEAEAAPLQRPAPQVVRLERHQNAEQETIAPTGGIALGRPGRRPGRGGEAT
jgi:hypothetical protein